MNRRAPRAGNNCVDCFKEKVRTTAEIVGNKTEDYAIIGAHGTILGLMHMRSGDDSFLAKYLSKTRTDDIDVITSNKNLQRIRGEFETVERPLIIKANYETKLRMVLAPFKVSTIEHGHLTIDMFSPSTGVGPLYLNDKIFNSSIKVNIDGFSVMIPPLDYQLATNLNPLAYTPIRAARSMHIIFAFEKSHQDAYGNSDVEAMKGLLVGALRQIDAGYERIVESISGKKERVAELLQLARSAYTSPTNSVEHDFSYEKNADYAGYEKRSRSLGNKLYNLPRSKLGGIYAQERLDRETALKTLELVKSTIDEHYSAG